MNLHEDPPIIEGVTPPKILGRGGRPQGHGCNISLLNRLKPGDKSSCAWGMTLRKKNSIRETAFQHGMKIKVRRLEGGLYAIWRLL
jgi:hypothetical protein